jgi:hypothetical protein
MKFWWRPKYVSLLPAPLYRHTSVSPTEKLSSEDVKILSERATIIHYMYIYYHVSLLKVCSFKGDKDTIKIIFDNK